MLMSVTNAYLNPILSILATQSLSTTPLGAWGARKTKNEVRAIALLPSVFRGSIHRDFR